MRKTQNSKNIFLIYGGGGTEHDVSAVSVKYLEKTIREMESDIYEYVLYKVELSKSNEWIWEGKKVKLALDGTFNIEGKSDWQKIHYAIPCIHGFPGETGDIQSFFELAKIPYLGCTPEGSINSFNKITTKLWLDSLKIHNSPSVIVNSKEDVAQAVEAFHKWGVVFIKASNQGSSVGCYRVDNLEDVKEKVFEAFKYSERVLVEKEIKGREFEIAVYNYCGELHVTNPGEIVTPSSTYYSFEEKYSNDSKTQTIIEAKNVDPHLKEKMKDMAHRTFLGMKLKDLSRVDFLYDQKTHEIYVNEINTFPGMTPISMFPKMLINHGDDFTTFLKYLIEKNL